MHNGVYRQYKKQWSWWAG